MATVDQALAQVYQGQVWNVFHTRGSPNRAVVVSEMRTPAVMHGQTVKPVPPSIRRSTGVRGHHGDAPYSAAAVRLRSSACKPLPSCYNRNAAPASARPPGLCEQMRRKRAAAGRNSRRTARIQKTSGATQRPSLTGAEWLRNWPPTRPDRCLGRPRCRPRSSRPRRSAAILSSIQWN
jgi:hypothetical protein